MKYNIELIENYLKEHNLSKSAFCKKCGISLSVLKSIYAGKVIRTLTAVRVLDELKVDFYCLIQFK